jgi:hypothetical protein
MSTGLIEPGIFLDGKRLGDDSDFLAQHLGTECKGSSEGGGPPGPSIPAVRIPKSLGAYTQALGDAAKKSNSAMKPEGTTMAAYDPKEYAKARCKLYKELMEKKHTYSLHFTKDDKHTTHVDSLDKFLKAFLIGECTSYEDLRTAASRLMPGMSLARPMYNVVYSNLSQTLSLLMSSLVQRPQCTMNCDMPWTVSLLLEAQDNDTLEFEITRIGESVKGHFSQPNKSDKDMETALRQALQEALRNDYKTIVSLSGETPELHILEGVKQLRETCYFNAALNCMLLTAPMRQALFYRMMAVVSRDELQTWTNLPATACPYALDAKMFFRVFYTVIALRSATHVTNRVLERLGRSVTRSTLPEGGVSHAELNRLMEAVFTRTNFDRDFESREKNKLFATQTYSPIMYRCDDNSFAWTECKRQLECAPGYDIIGACITYNVNDGGAHAITGFASGGKYFVYNSNEKSASEVNWVSPDDLYAHLKIKSNSVEYSLLLMSTDTQLVHDLARAASTKHKGGARRRSLESMNVPELRSRAVARGIKYRGLKKNDLIAALRK